MKLSLNIEAIRTKCKHYSLRALFRVSIANISQEKDVANTYNIGQYRFSN